MAAQTRFIVMAMTLMACITYVSSQQNSRCADPCRNVRCPGRCRPKQVQCFDPNAPCCPVAECITANENQEKPGSCPRVRPGQFGTCIERCRRDSECPGNHKCCSNGCGHTCQVPSRGEDPFCGDPCFSSPCAPGETCVAEQVQCNRTPCCPVVRCIKGRPGTGGNNPGSCPSVGPGQNGPCVEECRSDRDCRNNKKCCRNGCGRVCTTPRF